MELFGGRAEPFSQSGVSVSNALGFEAARALISINAGLGSRRYLVEKKVNVVVVARRR